jgi:hypothetical protein
MTSTPRKILPNYITKYLSLEESMLTDSTGNSNIKNYQARAAAQVFSTARNVLPNWTTNYFLPTETTSLSSSTLDLSPASSTSTPVATIQGDSFGDRFVGFDVLRGHDVIVTATEYGFSIYNIADGATEMQELCGYTTDGDVIYIKVTPKRALSYARSSLVMQKDLPRPLSSLKSRLKSRYPSSSYRPP